MIREEHAIMIASRIYSVMRMLNLDCCVPYPTWDEATEDQRTTFIDGVKFHLAYPNLTPQQTHDWWTRDKAAKGWTYGPVKDEAAKQHPSMVPYEELSAMERGKDVIFSEMCRMYFSTLAYLK